MLAAMDKNTGSRGTGTNQHQVRSSGATAPPTLASLGISKDQSFRWQHLAALSTEDQEAKIADAKRKVEAAVSAPMRRSPSGGGKVSGDEKTGAAGPTQDDWATKLTGQVNGLFSGEFKVKLMKIIEVREHICAPNRRSLAEALRNVERMASEWAYLLEAK
jgi:hypothetical protein